MHIPNILVIYIAYIIFCQISSSAALFVKMGVAVLFCTNITAESQVTALMGVLVKSCQD